MTTTADKTLSAGERTNLVKKYNSGGAIRWLREQRPALFITPHDHGQLQALKSDKMNRILIPGNGFGKSLCMALDADCLMQRSDPYKPHMMPCPDRPTTAIWVTQKHAQFEVMKPDLESIFTRGFVWREQKKMYVWPDDQRGGGGGSRLFILSADSDWSAIQGVEIDAVYFDEHPPKALWNEMQYRRRGHKKTRYMVAATMTLGVTWFVTGVIQPWEKHCRDLGLTNDEALAKQPHPNTFVWNVGGIEDNPAMTAEDAAHYGSVMTASEKERHVRLKGGYSDFTGEPVFYLPSLLEMQENAPPEGGESGALVFTGEGQRGQGVGVSGGGGSGGPGGPGGPGGASVQRGQ